EPVTTKRSKEVTDPNIDGKLVELGVEARELDGARIDVGRDGARAALRRHERDRARARADVDHGTLELRGHDREQVDRCRAGWHDRGGPGRGLVANDPDPLG